MKLLPTLGLPIRVLGVMTGTSTDGLDAACVEFSASGWGMRWSAAAPYPSALRKRVLAMQKPGVRAPIREWMELDADLGDWYGKTILKFLGKHQPAPDVIANHGQTLAHYPGARGGGTTLQLGDPARIAAITGLSVISQFRAGDLAAGGQGAPLLPLFHQLLAEMLDPEERGVAIHNMGGISNLTYLEPGQAPLAFDTGPANIWIDEAASRASRGKLSFDRDGKLASRGVIDVAAVQKLMKHPYFGLAAPKSTGRDDFPFELLTRATRSRGEDLVATATAVTVESVGAAYERFILRKKKPLARIFISGGGSRNKSLLAWLGERLPSIEVQSLESAGIDPQTVEAQGFALFGIRALAGLAVGGPWTGVKAFGPPAHIVPGSNWASVLEKLTSVSKA